jgi:hypothetical protein
MLSFVIALLDLAAAQTNFPRLFQNEGDTLLSRLIALRRLQAHMLRLSTLHSLKTPPPQ